MSFETTRDPERFRLLNQLFEVLLRTDPARWDDVVADRAVDPRLAAEARRLLMLDRSGAPDRYLKHLVTAAQAVVRTEALETDGVWPTGD
ncbi:MAG: hypothetical protein WEA34_01845 [Gemmatimonadota bacterium]